MRRIFKYELGPDEETILQIPHGSMVLDVSTQKGTPCVWMDVEDTNMKRAVEFRLCATGTSVPDGAYIGTAHNVANLGLVFHVYVSDIWMTK